MHLATPPALQREVIPLKDPIEAALALAAPELNAHRIEVVRHYRTDGDAGGGVSCVFADHSQLEQVFLNLITNACHAMPDGGLLVVETEHVATTTAAGALRARVTDTGSGIPPENLDHVFEPFFSTRNGGDGSGGHGLGLSVSYGIVNSHGGTLTVSSEVGAGSTFELSLPACAGEQVGTSAPHVGLHQKVS